MSTDSKRIKEAQLLSNKEREPESKKETREGRDVPKRIAVVTGANRTNGIGAAIVKGLASIPNTTVIFTSRKEEDGERALSYFHKLGLNNVVHRILDFDNVKGIDAFIDNVHKDFDHVDWLINNSGTLPPLVVEPSDILHTIDVNSIGAYRLLMGFLPKMKENNYGRIVNMSSTLGVVSDIMESSLGGFPGGLLAYRMSKAALNVITRTFAVENKDKNILINSMCPGVVDTDMSRDYPVKTKKTPDEGADTAIWLATLDESGPRGGFFRERKPLPW